VTAGAEGVARHRHFPEGSEGEAGAGAVPPAAADNTAISRTA